MRWIRKVETKSPITAHPIMTLKTITETGHAGGAVKKASVHNICKCVRKIDDQGSETHGSTGNLCRYFHLSSIERRRLRAW